MSEGHEHNTTLLEDPLPGPTWLVGFIGTVMALVIVLGVTALLRMTQQETFEEISVDVPPVEMMEMSAAADEHFTADPRYQEYVDTDGTLKQRLIIPLDDAMDQVVQENN